MQFKFTQKKKQTNSQLEENQEMTKWNYYF